MIPNIWENKIDVPNHQPNRDDIFIISITSRDMMTLPWVGFNGRRWSFHVIFLHILFQGSLLYSVSHWKYHLVKKKRKNILYGSTVIINGKTLHNVLIEHSWMGRFAMASAKGGCDCASYSCRKPWLQMKHSHPKHFPTFTDYPTVSPNSPKCDGSPSPTSCITPPGTSSDILGPDPAFQSRTLNCTFLVSFKRLSCLRRLRSLFGTSFPADTWDALMALSAVMGRLRYSMAVDGCEILKQLVSMDSMAAGSHWKNDL